MSSRSIRVPWMDSRWGNATTATASRGRKIRGVVDLEALEYSRLEDDLEALEAHGDHADTLREIVWIYS